MSTVHPPPNVLAFQKATKIDDEQMAEIKFADFLSGSADQNHELIKPISTAQYQKSMGIVERIEAARNRIAVELQEG